MNGSLRLLVTLVLVVAFTAAPGSAGSTESGDQPVAVYVRSYDGAYVGAALRKPTGEGPFPAILFIHGGVGGSTIDAMKRFVMRRVPQHFFERGYVVFSTDYRGLHFGEDEIQDVLAAYRKVQSYPFVEKNRVGVIGGSHGGYLAMMLATRISPAVAVSFAGLSDIEGMFYDVAQDFSRSLEGWAEWRQQLLASKNSRRNRSSRAGADSRPAARPETARRFPGNASLRPGSAAYQVALDLAWRLGDRRELYRAISPKDNAHRITCPLLYVVGSKDRLRMAGKALMAGLRERGVMAEYSEHEGMGHGFYWGSSDNPPQQFHDALKVTSAFVERHLRKVVN